MRSKLLLPILFCLSLTACGRDSGTVPAQTANEQTTQQTVPAEDTCSAVISENADAPLPDQGTLMNGLEYEISNGSSYDSRYQQRGWYINNADGKYQYIICSGERHTGGYSIKIARLDTLDIGTVIVTVEETAPSPDTAVTEAFTFPNCSVTFSQQLPADIIIKNAAGTEFEYLGTVPDSPDESGDLQKENINPTAQTETLIQRSIDA